MKNNRTFLEKLLDGAEVKWKPLGKVTDIKTGQSVSKTLEYTLSSTVDVNP